MPRSVARALFQGSEQPGAESARQFMIEKNIQYYRKIMPYQDAGITMAVILCTAFNAQFFGETKADIMLRQGPNTFKHMHMNKV
uniref:Uncharacterized protein n=1 Tax=Coccidioides posadasii RMSCC 3488 TaxID=454284 RepID=A0A0J6FKD4_COCPO|nr:hypothetical protein CPAG_07099 [Coccidioides posadasii RMSCC 3488]